MKVIVAGNIGQSLVNFRGPMMQAMTEQGHEVVAVGPDGDTEYVPALEKLGVRYRTAPLDRAGFNPIADLKYLWSLRKLMLEERPDVFLGYTIKPVIYGNLAARLAKVRTRSAIITGLGYAFGEQGAKQRVIGTIIKVLYRAALSGATVVFFQNPDDRNEFLKLGFVDDGRAALVAGSGVDLSHFVNSTPPPGPPVFLMVARLIREKGIDQFVAAARQLKQKYPSATFQVLGPIDANPTAVSVQEIDTWRQEGIIEYLGETKDVRPYLSDCSVFVLPSYYREGTPRTALEALATGRPVVTTNAPGCRETVVDGVNGYLVEPRSSKALTTALEAFLEDPERVTRMGLASLDLARRKFDVRLVNRDILTRLGLVRSGEVDIGSATE